VFQSFFPRPKLFLLSALGWVAVAVALWYTQGGAMGAWFGFPPTDPAAEPVLGLGHFVTPQFLWFYLYCAAFLAVFTAAWFILSPHPYQWWSVVGTAVILFSTYFNVQVSVAINNWRRPFFDDVLAALSVHVTELPLVGAIASPLLYAALFWSAFGTLLLAVAGIRLPGLNFRNQRVEAAYRKELVYGEDDAERAGPMTTHDLFRQVRTNYFRLYFNYAYFNVFRGMYLQADNVFGYLILIPTIAAGKITFGVLQQILTAFNQVSSSFQYLVNSWSTIIELLSIHKRLAAFEAAFEGRTLAPIEQEHPLTP